MFENLFFTRLATPEGGAIRGPFPSPMFWVPKRKEGNKEKKERVSKQKLLKTVTKVKMLLFCHSRSSRIQKFFLSKRNVMADNTFLRQPFFKNVFLFSTIYYFRTKLKNPHHKRFLSLSFFTVLLPFPFSEFFLFIFRVIFKVAYINIFFCQFTCVRNFTNIYISIVLTTSPSLFLSAMIDKISTYFFTYFYLKDHSTCLLFHL